MYLLDGDKTIAELLNGRDVHLSFITELELIGYKGLNDVQIQTINNFLNDCIIINLNQSIKQHSIAIRKKYKVKLPDAIIAATSQYLNIPLISADSGFEKIETLTFLKYDI